MLVSHCLTDFTQHDNFYVHPCCYKCCYFFPFNGWGMFHCVYVPHLLYPLFCLWTFKLFPCFGYCTKFSSLQRESHSLITSVTEAHLKTTWGQVEGCTPLILIINPILEPFLYSSSSNPPKWDTRIFFEGISLLCSPLPGKVIILFFSLSPKTQSRVRCRGQVSGNTSSTFCLLTGMSPKWIQNPIGLTL